MIALVPSLIYAEGNDGLFVNQFVPSRARLRPGGEPPVAIRQETGYPERDSVRIRVDPDQTARFILYLRIPDWCAGASATINGVPCLAGDVRTGAYFALDRTWTAGDRVDLRLPMRVAWARARGVEAGAGADRRWALTRGPAVFVVDTVLWDGPTTPPRSAGSDLTVVLDGAGCYEAAPLPEGALGPGLRIPVELADGSRVQARAWPFANVGAWFRPGVPRPGRDRAAFSYAVWLRGRGDAP